MGKNQRRRKKTKYVKSTENGLFNKLNDGKKDADEIMNKSKSILGDYVHAECLFKTEDFVITELPTDEVKQMLPSLDSLPQDFVCNMKGAKIIVPSSHMVDKEKGGKMMKLFVTQKNNSTEKALMKERDPRNLCGDANIILIEREAAGNDANPQLMGIILKGIIPFDLTLQYSTFLKHYEANNTYFTSGCKATAWPASDIGRIMKQLKDELCMDAAGFKKNVKHIHDIKITSTGMNVQVLYENQQGRLIRWNFSPNLDRKAFLISKLNELKCQKLLQFMENLYESITKHWMKNNGCPENMVESEWEKVKQKLQLCGNKINQSTSWMGVHSDPSLPFPSGIFGPTTHTLNEEEMKWERQCEGGELLLVDGFIPMRYGPQDVVFIDGNLLHAVTNLCNQSYVDRFSMQIYTDYLRNTNKYGKYGTYDSRIWN